MDLRNRRNKAICPVCKSKHEKTHKDSNQSDTHHSSTFSSLYFTQYPLLHKEFINIRTLKKITVRVHCPMPVSRQSSDLLLFELAITTSHVQEVGFFIARTLGGEGERERVVMSKTKRAERIQKEFITFRTPVVEVFYAYRNNRPLAFRFHKRHIVLREFSAIRTFMELSRDSHSYEYLTAESRDFALTFLYSSFLILSHPHSCSDYLLTRQQLDSNSQQQQQHHQDAMDEFRFDSGDEELDVSLTVDQEPEPPLTTRSNIRRVVIPAREVELVDSGSTINMGDGNLADLEANAEAYAHLRSAFANSTIGHIARQSAIRLEADVAMEAGLPEASSTPRPAFASIDVTAERGGGSPAEARGGEQAPSGVPPRTSGLAPAVSSQEPEAPPLPEGGVAQPEVEEHGTPEGSAPAAPLVASNSTPSEAPDQACADVGQGVSRPQQPAVSGRLLRKLEELQARQRRHAHDRRRRRRQREARARDAATAARPAGETLKSIVTVVSPEGAPRTPSAPSTFAARDVRLTDQATEAWRTSPASTSQGAPPGAPLKRKASRPASGLAPTGPPPPPPRLSRPPARPSAKGKGAGKGRGGPREGEIAGRLAAEKREAEKPGTADQVRARWAAAAAAESTPPPAIPSAAGSVPAPIAAIAAAPPASPSPAPLPIAAAPSQAVTPLGPPLLPPPPPPPPSRQAFRGAVRGGRCARGATPSPARPFPQMPPLASFSASPSPPPLPSPEQQMAVINELLDTQRRQREATEYLLGEVERLKREKKD